MSDLHSLVQLAEIQRELDEQTREVVEALRADGHSWAAIGEACGMSASDAQRRFRDRSRDHLYSAEENGLADEAFAVLMRASDNNNNC